MQSESITALWPQQGLLFDKNWFVVEWSGVENTKPCNFGIQAINICKRLMMVLSGPSCPVESPLEREGG